MRGSIKDSKIEIQSLPDEEKSLMRSKNYSKKYHTRWLKDTDSSVAWQTGLLKVEGTFKNKIMIKSGYNTVFTHNKRTHN